MANHTHRPHVAQTLLAIVAVVAAFALGSAFGSPVNVGSLRGPEILAAAGIATILAIWQWRFFAEIRRQSTACDALLARYRLLVDTAHDIILFVRRSDGSLIDANRAAIEAYGYERDALLRLTIAEIRAPETQSDIPTRFAQIDRGFIVFQTIHRRRDGTTFPVEVSSSQAMLDGERIVVTIARDLTERKAAEAERARLEREIDTRSQSEVRLAFAALHDGLTGLPNRALVLERIDEAIARQRLGSGEIAAIFFLDVDRFKSVNDRFGHRGGDELLVEIAVRLSRHVRHDEMLARFGGDEFVVLIAPLADETTAIAIAQRIIASFETPFDIGGSVVHVSTSIGIAIGRGATRSAAQLLHDADLAMYEAKDAGRNRYAISGSAR